MRRAGGVGALKSQGIVYLVGAGPGDPSLFTLRGMRLLKCADVVVYDRLAPMALLSMCRADSIKIDVGKVSNSGGQSQQTINDLLIEHAQSGMTVVRLKGGDPGVFGRASEEHSACLENGVPCVIVPGVSSCLAAPASIGLTATQRGRSRSFTVLAARGSDGSGAEGLDYSKLVRDETLIVLMGRKELGAICSGLIGAGGDPHLSVACIENATTSRQRQCRGTLENIAAKVEQRGLQAPMVTIIGEIASAKENPQAFALSPLVGVKVAITGTPTLCHKLAEELMSRGAEPIVCPLIRIDFSHSDPALDNAISDIARFDWMAFSSANSVRGFFGRLSDAGKDSRALANCRIASVADATSRELLRHGVRADLQPQVETGEALAAAIIEASSAIGRRILLPRSDRALKTLPECLKAAGMNVTQAIAYRTVSVDPPALVVEEINRMADAILFASPSAVRCAVDAGIQTQAKTVVCIGETTATFARKQGIAVDAAAKRASAEAMVDALAARRQAKLGLLGVGA
jgi:uroporphyrinogen III methyltransferase/synthase